MNLFESLVGNAQLGEMAFGINDNCYIKSLEKTKKGEKKHTFIKFVQQIDGEDMSEFVASWWAIDPTNEDYAFSNYREYVTQLVDILKCFYSEEVVMKEFNDKLFGEYESLEKVQEDCVSQRGARALTTRTQDAFEDMIMPWINDTDNLIRVKVVTDRNGRRADIPGYRGFTESMKVEETKLFITKTEQSRRDTIIETQAKAEQELGDLMDGMPGDNVDMSMTENLDLPGGDDDVDPIAGGVDELLNI